MNLSCAGDAAAAVAADLAQEDEAAKSRAVAQERPRRLNSAVVRDSQDARPGGGLARCHRVSAYPPAGEGGARVTCAINVASRDKFEIEPKNEAAAAAARCRELEREEVFEQFTQIKLHDDDDDKEGEPTETNYERKHERCAQSESRHHGQRQLDNESKLAPTKDKAAIIDREQPAVAATGVKSSGGGGGGGGGGSGIRETTTAAAAVAQPKRGLLEALLGNRGKSWLEHKTVVLDIQNGKKRERARQAAGDKNNQQQQHNSTTIVDELRRETFTRLEESGDNDDDDDDDQDENSKSGQRNVNELPTFGSVPKRLTRLPYFTYHGGQASAQVTTRRGADFGKSGAQQVDQRQEGRYKLLASYAPRQKAGSVASFNSSAASTTSSGHSPAPRRLPPTAPGTCRRSAASQLGYSNISNLFPGEPASVRPHTATKARRQQTYASPAASSHGRKSASVLDLRATEQREQTIGGQLRAAQQPTPTPGPQQVALSERRKSHFSALSPMTRRNSFAAPQQQQQQQTLQTHAQRVDGHTHTRPHSQQSLTQRHEQRQQEQRQMATLRRQQQLQQQQHNSAKLGAARSRPLSATGGYLSGGHRRSPSASSAYRLGSAGMSPLVDPDCPVHGDSPTGQPALGGASGRRRTASDYQRGQQPIYSSSQPDLLYGGGGVPRGVSAADRDDLYDPYNTPYYPIYDSAYQHLNGHGGGKHHATPPQYSPVSPTRVGAGEHQHQTSRYAGHTRSPTTENSKQPPVNGGPNQPAYYDGSSRFSLYHPAATGAGAAGEPPGRVRSSLAPTGEQLRRIIGYRPAPVAPRPVHLHPQWAYTRPFIHLKPAGSGFGRSPTPPFVVDPYDPDGGLIDQFMDAADDAPKFAPFNRLQDNQAIRAVDFHPSGEVYAIGSNSRALRICAYPAEHELRHFDPFDQSARDHRRDAGGGGGGGQQDGQQVAPPRVLFKFLQVHRGSIYCVSFNPSGQLLATGSNDQTVHIVKYNSITHNPDGEEFRLTMHNGTVRDLCFIDDSSGNGSSLLLSAGGGDNKIYVTDCDTITPFQSMAGHTQMVMALSHCGGAQFVSGSYDRTIRFWDLRSRSCTSIVSAPPCSPALGAAQAGSQTGPGAPVCALRVDPSGRLLASGHTDSTCMLYDIRGGKIIQTYRPHDDEIRAISFSPKSYYLLTGGYDGRLVVSDLQGDLTQPLPSACVAESQDKIVQAKWHPADFTFVSTSADKSATLWSLPGEIRD